MKLLRAAISHTIRAARPQDGFTLSEILVAMAIFAAGSGTYRFESPMFSTQDKTMRQ